MRYFCLCRHSFGERFEVKGLPVSGREANFLGCDDHRQYLSQQDMKRIAEIVDNGMAELDCEMENDVTYQLLSPFELRAYKLYDGTLTRKHHVLVCQ